VTEAVLNESGKMPSERARLMIVVIGKAKVSRQDLRRKVGMMSREQEAFEAERMAFLTSWILAGSKVEQEGGVR
jgi:hypothetical protein